MSRAALGAGHAVGGAATAVLALVVHRHAVVAVGVVWPWGLALALAALLATTLAATTLGGTRTGTFPFAGAVAVVLLLATRTTAGGSYLFAADVRGYGLLLGSAVAVGGALVVAVRPGRAGSPTVGA